jgi:hypothetical protein
VHDYMMPVMDVACANCERLPIMISIITSTRDAAGRVAWFVNADDVERARLERLGRQWRRLRRSY